MYRYPAPTTETSQDSTGAAGISRRCVLASLAALGMIGSAPLRAQPASLLPLNTAGLDHFDIISTDVHDAARFYMGVFRTVLHAQPVRDTLRYFVLFGELDESRQVGYLAIGDLRGRLPAIGHFCTSIVDWRSNREAIFASMAEAFAKAGFGTFPGARFDSLFTDPDGIELQFLPAPDVLVNEAVPSDLVVPRQGLVTPRGVDHVVLHVSDLERAVQYYEILYGPVTSRDARSATFAFSNGSRLVLEPVSYEYGQGPKIASACVKVDRFDRAVVEAGLKALGADVLPAGDTPDLLAFRDPDGLKIVLRPV